MARTAAATAALPFSLRPPAAVDAATGERLPVLRLEAPALSSATHLPALDGLRGVALLLVVVNHLFGAQYRELGNTVARLTHTGWVGVDLFFVLSGFLITGILWDAKGAPHFFRNFYARRALRIAPLYIAAVFATAVVLPWLVGAPAGRAGGVGRLAEQLRFIGDRQLWLWACASNFAQAVRGASWHMAGHFWSLAVEEQFYLVWPLVIRLIRDRRDAGRFCLVVAAASTVFRLTLVAIAGDTLDVYYLTFCRAEGLALGGFVALAARAPGGLEPLVRPAKGVAIGVGTMLLVWGAARGGLDNHDDPLVQTVGFPAVAAFFAAVLVLAVAGPAPPTGALAAPALRWVGRYSYGLYVFHHLALYLTPVVVPAARLKSLTGSPVSAALLTTALNAALSVAAALASYHLLEARLLRLKRHFPVHA